MKRKIFMTKWWRGLVALGTVSLFAGVGMRKGLFIGCMVAMALITPAITPVSAADWKDSDCRQGKDESGARVDVCRNQESIGIFWDDGSYVNGWCDNREYDIDYKGVSKKEAISWVEYYCG
jgi:hypothetical protein